MLVTSLASADTARADGAAERCVAQSDEGQFLRDHGKLLLAREALVACAQDSCPQVVRKACAEWLDDVTSRLPTVVLSVVDARGATIRAEVQLDGAPAKLPLGTAAPVDPGFHVFQARVPGRPVVELKVQLQETQKNVPVKLVVPEPAPPAETTRPSRVPAMTWVLGGLALAGAGVSVGFWRDAVGKGEDLERSCAPGCTDDEIAPVERSLLVSRVAGGVAIGAALAAVGWLVLAPPSSAAPSRVRASAGGVGFAF